MNQTSPKAGAGNASSPPIKSPTASLDGGSATPSGDEHVDLQQVQATGKALNREFASISNQLASLMATLVPNEHFREIEWPIPAQGKRAKARRKLHINRTSITPQEGLIIKTQRSKKDAA